MTETKPVVYLLRGDDREKIESKIRDFFTRLGEPDLAEMNTTRLEGQSASLNDLRSAALALPFLTERRLVIIENALAPYSGRGSQKDHAPFIELLESLPETTALVLVTPDSQEYKRQNYQWKVLKDTHWLISWAKNAGGRAMVIDCALPTDREMIQWVKQKASELGGSFTPAAAQTLADYIGNNTQRAAQEVVKLLTFVNFERPVDDDDVRRLTVQDFQGDIFALVDAIGSRNGGKALEHLHILLAEGDLPQIFGMIVRQFRLLIQAREILAAGGNAEDVAKTLNQHPFVAQKVAGQSSQFDLGKLEEIYRQLLMIDVEGKSSGMDVDLALDILIARLAT